MTKHPAFNEFVETIAALRAPDGCPWDREQTHESIAKNMIEEAYEAVDAIEADDIVHLREELGDVLLQVVLQSQIAADAGEFTIDDVCHDVNAKIVRRHPHVFGDAVAGSASDVTELWDEVKRGERQAKQDGRIEQAGQSTQIGQAGQGDQTEDREGILDSVPVSFPALMQAQKISRKVVAAGFEWETIDDVWQQVYSEIEELKEAYAEAPKDSKGKVTEDSEVTLEMGDVLFTLVNIARKMGIDAETALRATCNKFRRRWAFMEGAAWAQGVEIESLSVEQMEELWAQAKERE